MAQQTNTQKNEQQENCNQPTKKVVIIGAGLGGLAVAIALRKLGYEVQVYEKARDFRPVGGGLGLLPNGLNSLDAIEPGIVETIKQSACEVGTTFLKNTQGETLSQNADEAKSRLLEQLTDWGESLRSLVEAMPAEQIMENPIYDRLPVPSWSHGRVTLLGDAAHAMAPALAQGSNTTFEDAYELASCFSQASSIQQALAYYEKRRIFRIQLIQNCSALGEKRYYATKQEQEEINRQMQEQSSMSREEFQNWLQNYKPSYQLN